MNPSANSSCLLGNSPAIQQVRDTIARLARTMIPVLVQGPTGSGKEMVARSLHGASGRGPLVPVNVCAISDAMFEDALFGHVRGAFTGAVSDSRGFLAEAHDGTLFLDEVSGLAPTIQPKLLRAIETGEFRPVGAAADRTSAFRLICASNENLALLVEIGRFRPDLAQRIAASTIRLPALQERPDDIPVLVVHFIREAEAIHGLRGTFSPGAMRILQAYSWPGNVRQLRHVVSSALALAPSPRIGSADVRALLPSAAKPMTSPGDALARRRLVDVLTRANWDIDRTALTLGVHRVTVYRHMKRLGVTPRSKVKQRNWFAEGMLRE